MSASLAPELQRSQLRALTCRGFRVATYSFETITAAQALGFTATDSLTFAVGTATDASVLFNGAVTTVSLGAHSVDFGVAISAASQTNGITFGDHSTLFIGGGGNDLIILGSGTTQSAALFGAVGADTLSLGPAGGLA